jgi:L-aspartate oxidase
MAEHHDVIIVGSGAAGLTAALALAQNQARAGAAKGALTGGSTAWAQGGIAAVLDAGRHLSKAISSDTMIAGAGLNNRKPPSSSSIEARRMRSSGWRAGRAVQCPKAGRRWHLTREGGHSHRRIVHVDDATGWAVQQALVKAAEANPNITLLPDRSRIDLITGKHEERYSATGRVWGVYALNRKTGMSNVHTRRATMLATGGAGRVYLFSTAPRGATGDGIAMAWRAGCRVSNME